MHETHLRSTQIAREGSGRQKAGGEAGVKGKM